MQQSAVIAAAPGVLVRLASLRLTLALIALLGVSALVAYFRDGNAGAALALPLGLLAVNLAAAIMTNPVFRRQTALLMFHLALLVLVLLLAASRLTYLTGHFEVTEGLAFDGELIDAEGGPFHAERLARAAFVNDGFSIEYAAGLKRGRTENRVRWRDDAGREMSATIGDQRALVLHGYRFYTTSNKGFAPMFTWIAPDSRVAAQGAVHLPSYPVHEHEQAREWQPPGARAPIWVMLKFDGVLLDPDRPTTFKKPAAHRIVVRAGDERVELQPGERAQIAGGWLVYDGLRTWMGYTLFYDWTQPWLLAASMLAALSLAWHFWAKFSVRPC